MSAFSQTVEKNTRRALNIPDGQDMPEKYYDGPWKTLRAVQEGKVIDLHCHSYETRTQGSNYEETQQRHASGDFVDYSDEMIESFDRHGIAKGCLIPAFVPFEQVVETSYAKHKDRYILTAGMPTREMVRKGQSTEDLSPHELADIYRYFLEEHKVNHIGEGGGGALRTLSGKLGPRAVKPVIDVILEYDVPVHFDPGSWSPTGTGLRFGGYRSSAVIDEVSAPLVVAYPDVKFIIAHCGGQYWQEDGWKVTRLLFSTDNTYTEISKTFNSDLIRTVVRGIGPDRVMYGSDWNRPSMKTYGPYHLRPAYQHWNSLSTLAGAGLTQEENDWVCYKTAQKVLKLEDA